MGYLSENGKKILYKGSNSQIHLDDERGLILSGNTTVFDDIRTTPINSFHAGARSPYLETIANDGSVGINYSLGFDGSGGVDIPYYSAMNSDEITINMWINVNTNSSIELLDRSENGYFEFYVSNGDLKIKWANNTVTASNVITVGQTLMITAVAKVEGANTRIKLYVNNTMVEEEVINAVIPTNSTNGYKLGEYYNGSWEFNGKIDGLYIYNLPLSDSQINELYNNGAGSLNHPNGVTENTDVIAKFDFDEGTGTITDNNSTLGAGYDISLNNGNTWEEGLLGITTGSVGVMALVFEPNKITEIFGSVQFPHQYKEGSTIYPHVHWIGEDTQPGDVVWKLEYKWINIGETVSGSTKIVERVVSNNINATTHRMTNIPSEGINGENRTISSILQYRLYRDGTNSNDTYEGKVYLSEFDIHYEIDTIGSAGQFNK